MDEHALTCCCDQITARAVVCPVHYTCPSECVEANHPGREHLQWVDALHAERDALAATVERVRALCDEWAEPTHYPAVALRLRAALDRPPHPEGTG